LIGFNPAWLAYCPGLEAELCQALRVGDLLPDGKLLIPRSLPIRQSTQFATRPKTTMRLTPLRVLQLEFREELNITTSPFCVAHHALIPILPIVVNVTATPAARKLALPFTYGPIAAAI
jgi:hypothetical protein